VCDILCRVRKDEKMFVTSFVDDSEELKKCSDYHLNNNCSLNQSGFEMLKKCPFKNPGADAIKKFTPGLGIPYLGV